MDQLIEKVSSYFGNQKDVIAVYLYGSYASGKQVPFSDMDIGVILHEKVLMNADAFQLNAMTELSRIVRKDVHLIILNHASEQLLHQVFLKGRCIFFKDKKKMALFRMRAFTKIADFEYHKKKMQLGLLNRITGI